jgi:hypothetical protein
MSRFASKAHLGSIINDWAPYCVKAVRDLLSGRPRSASATRLRAFAQRVQP